METDQATILRGVMKPYRNGAIAVSGGVDSMTLAAFAHTVFGSDGIRMVHAKSPAVPAGATARIRRYSAAKGWALTEVDAGEFSDPSYRANPANRCFYCKTNLYRSVRKICNGTIMSGTNCDDLNDYRPGLTAAENYNVQHPYVEAGMDKNAVRTLARAMGLTDLADLPASPCLSSRIQTGIQIDVDQLHLVDTIETWLHNFLSSRTVRCRIRHEAIVIELDRKALNKLSQEEQKLLIKEVEKLLPVDFSRPVNLTTYQRGSAFDKALSPTIT